MKSGTWEGWYGYDGVRGRHAWSADLTIDGGRLQGKGTDDIGAFTFDGEVDGAVVRWQKRYRRGADVVHYRGKLDGDGKLSGEWKLPSGSHGPFAAARVPEDARPAPAEADETFDGDLDGEFGDDFPGGDADFDVASFKELIREIRPLVDQIEKKYRGRFPDGLPHWTELPPEALAELPGGDDTMSDLFGFFLALDEHVFDGID